MKAVQTGFTLIELVMVIVIIGILAVVAVPKFIDMSGDAKQAAVDGVAGALSSAGSVNYAARKANSTAGTAVDNCDDGAALLQAGALPSGYSITAAAVAANAVKTDCVVLGPASAASASFTAIGIN